MNEIFDLSVHQLVDFVLRGGSIDTRFNNATTMLEGTLLHKYYQNKQSEQYLSEVYLEGDIEFNNFLFKLHGRCDGLFFKNNETFIDEIKTTKSNLDDFFNENFKWHIGQAECYAFLYARKNNLKKINVQLTYISQKNKSILQKTYSYDFEDLQKKIYSYLLEYLDFYKLIIKLKNERNNSLVQLNFPFETLRKGQEDLLNFSFDTLSKKEVAFVEASTGLGKTVSTLYSALKSFKNENYDKIFYLSAKNSGFYAANNTFNLFLEKGMKFKVANILGKEKMCISQVQKCDPENCIFARNYFTKIKSVIRECLISRNIFTEEYLKDIAWKYEVCPFELSLDLSLYSDFILCDYNYVFHPTSKLKRFFESPDKDYKMFLLVDEAHNLVNRSREMYSAELHFSHFDNFKNEFLNIKNVGIKNIINEVEEDIKLFNNFIFEDDNGKPIYDIILETLDNKFISNLKDLNEKYKKYCDDHPKFYSKVCDDFSLEIYKFLTIYDYLTKNYVIYIHKNKNSFYIKLYCLDASEFLNDIIHHVDGALFFSGTLTPLEYYQNAILGHCNFKNLTISSPFDKKNFNLMINDTTSLLYSKRNETICEICNYIEAFVSYKKGNYLVFVPSFDYLFLLKKNLKQNKEVKYIFQNKNMTLLEKNAFIDNFSINENCTTIGFAVIGGSFAEGIDLVGEKLIGVIILGIGLPSFDFENNLIKENYNKKDFDGFDYSYINPALNRVMQALGRLIRSENDKGSALLIDTRYFDSRYKNFYKKEYLHYINVKNVKDVRNTLKKFYEN